METDPTGNRTHHSMVMLSLSRGYEVVQIYHPEMEDSATLSLLVPRASLPDVRHALGKYWGNIPATICCLLFFSGERINRCSNPNYCCKHNAGHHAGPDHCATMFTFQLKKLLLLLKKKYKSKDSIVR